MLLVEGIPARDNGVQAIVAAEPFEHDENPAPLGCRRTADRLGKQGWRWTKATEKAEPDATRTEAK